MANLPPKNRPQHPREEETDEDVGGMRVMYGKPPFLDNPRKDADLARLGPRNESVTFLDPRGNEVVLRGQPIPYDRWEYDEEDRICFTKPYILYQGSIAIPRQAGPVDDGVVVIEPRMR